MREQGKYTPNLNLVMNTVIGFLILLVLLLGYFVYQKLANSSIDSPSSQVNQIEDTMNNSGDADLRVALNPPPRGATEDEFRTYFQAVQRVTVDTDSVDIVAGCSISPSVVRLSPTSHMTFNNTDIVDHTISFDKDFSFVVSAGHSTTTIVNLTDVTEGLFGFGCDQSPTASGMVWVTSSRS